MITAKARLILLVAVFIGAAGGYWAYENLEWKEVRVPGTMQGEAARNDLLAAERLVNAMGGKARSEYAYTQPPAGDPRQSVLVFPTERRILTARQRAQLIKWIEDGGHLVAVTYSLEGDDVSRPSTPRTTSATRYARSSPTSRRIWRATASTWVRADAS